MKLHFEFACDQINSTNHSLLIEISSSASCQHILTECIMQLYLHIHGHITFKYFAILVLISYEPVSYKIKNVYVTLCVTKPHSYTHTGFTLYIHNKVCCKLTLLAPDTGL